MITRCTINDYHWIWSWPFIIYICIHMMWHQHVLWIINLFQCAFGFVWETMDSTTFDDDMTFKLKHVSMLSIHVCILNAKTIEANRLFRSWSVWTSLNALDLFTSDHYTNGLLKKLPSFHIDLTWNTKHDITIRLYNNTPRSFCNWHHDLFFHPKFSSDWLLGNNFLFYFIS